ncbi:cation-translocating P-type ATPase [Mycobacterium sp. OTB74]|uniref:cation-translocating P-type ATPase n=1 Tax=Mycobacterium sp. OTB74 TaxID=1853452 RepID=UPI0024738DD5|nr:cation-translocating P-type ATPase [Mycobacterium sp. OTB74]
MTFRAVAMGVNAATAVTTAGVSLATAPIRDGARILNREISSAALGRRCWSNGSRAWIEVRGLSDSQGSPLGEAVLDAVRARPGVTFAALNYPVSRVVVRMNSGATSLRTLCDVIAAAEKECAEPESRRRPQPVSLPGDGLAAVQPLAAVAANAVGLGVALAGRALVWTGLPASIAGAVMAVDYQPKVRGLLEERLGRPTADTVLALATAAVYTVTLAPPSLAVDLVLNILRTAEVRANALTWNHKEPELFRHAESTPVYAPSRPVPLPDGVVERHANRTAWAQALGAGALGLLTMNPTVAGTAAMVATPKAARMARESFAATLSRGLADHHGAVVLGPAELRRLDRVDALLIDPRVLCTDQLRLTSIRGVEDRDRTAAWDYAQQRLADDGQVPGWRRVGLQHNGAEVLLEYEHHRMASAVVAAARQCGLTVVSVDADDLGEFRSALDEILPVNGSIDDALAHATTTLQEGGHTVAVVSTAAVHALSSADLALGVMPHSDRDPPPWCAHVLLDDLTAVWRVLHAIPAARTASRRGVEIATGASALGALLMVPGVRGVGPGAVTTGAASGLLTGYWLARGALRTAIPVPAPVYEWHAMSADQVRRMLPRSDIADRLPTPNVGMIATGAAFARWATGVATAPARAAWQFGGAVRAELADPLTPVLAGGAGASAVLGSPVDAVMVGSVVGGNAVLAAVQRLHAERLLNRLLAEQIPPARVMTADRADMHRAVTVAASLLRPGDLIEVGADEIVPADCRLVEATDLEVDESALTGESLPVDKQVAATPGAELAERQCMLYAGTTVMTGKAVAVVTAVGADTQARRAASLVAQTAQSVGLQHQLSQLTDKAWPVSLVGGALVTGLGLLRLTGIREAVASGVAVAVAAVPEGLPLVATLAQQASARRLTNEGVLVRSPRSVEALGRVEVICFDKTGTLSQNRLRVTQVVPAAESTRADLLYCAARATPIAQDGVHVHATDMAVVEAAAEYAANDLPEALAHLPFRPGRPFSASVVGDELTVKGAPEVVLTACREADPSGEQDVAALASRGLRVIAVARRQLSQSQVRAVRDDSDVIAELCSEGLSFVGLVGISDVPRPDAPELLAELVGQGLSVRLITGDHPITAAAIATELGMSVTAQEVLCGAEWEALSRKGQEEAVATRVVFARMSPENKVQVVQTLERIGHVCAMVGDGANDAAAIRAATVGIGVVAHGSDPAHMAADVVLVDGRIRSLLDALAEGRQLWQRVQSAVAVLLGGNAGEVMFAIIGSALTGRSPLNARQLLMVNMLTDALPAAALAVSPPRGPTPADRHGLDQQSLWRTVGIRGVITAGAAVVAWLLARFTGRRQRASTVALVALVATQLGQTLLDSRGWLVLLTALGSVGVMAALISIPGVSQLLGCTPLGPIGWAQALGTAAIATALAAVAPERIARWTTDGPEGDDQSTDQSTISSSPKRNNTAYNSRSGTVRRSAANPVSGSVETPSILDTSPTVTV